MVGWAVAAVCGLSVRGWGGAGRFDLLRGSVVQSGKGGLLGWVRCVEGDDSVAGGGFGGGGGGSFGCDEVGVVEEPVDRGGGEGFGHDGVESGWVGVGAAGNRPPFEGGVHEAVERFAWFLAGG